VSDRERVAELYRLYGPAVYRRCVRLLRDRQLARDATQEVFVKLVRDIGKLERQETALPWMYRVATNHCLNLLRDVGRRPAEPIEDLEISGDVDEAERLPARHLARDLLSRFDEGTRAVAVGVLVDGMKHEEVAEALGVSRKTVQRRLDRFLERSRALLGGSAP
jgi:RNA polymerase sigma-70 factor (ECF subfamily)